jgi:F0F1-type ATP synthase assembly protein I
VGLAGLAAISHGDVAATSVLLGGMAAVIPNGFLAARLMQPRADDSAEAIMRSAWLGEIGKLLLTALLFGVIFAAIRPLNPRESSTRRCRLRLFARLHRLSEDSVRIPY